MNLKNLWKNNWDLIIALALFPGGILFGGTIAQNIYGSVNMSAKVIMPLFEISLLFFAISIYRSFTVKYLSKWRWWTIIGLFLIAGIMVLTSFGRALS